MRLTEKALSRRDVFTGRIFRVHVDQVLLENGAVVSREVVEHSGGVGVLAVDAQEMVYLVRQFRYGAGEVLPELPAGKLEPGEDPAACGRRELLEETGMTAADFTFLAELLPTPAYCGERIRVYLARILTPAAQKLDENEFLNVERLPFSEVLQMCMDGRITDAKTLVGVFKYAMLRG